MKKNELIFKIKNKEYILLERTFTAKDRYRGERLEKALRKIGVISQGVKKIQPSGWFSNPYCILRYLVPINKIDHFDKLVDDLE